MAVGYVLNDATLPQLTQLGPIAEANFVCIAREWFEARSELQLPLQLQVTGCHVLITFVFRLLQRIGLLGT